MGEESRRGGGCFKLACQRTTANFTLFENDAHSERARPNPTYTPNWLLFKTRGYVILHQIEGLKIKTGGEDVAEGDGDQEHCAEYR